MQTVLALAVSARNRQRDRPLELRKVRVDLLRRRRSNLRQIQLHLRGPAGGNSLLPPVRLNRKPVAEAPEETLATCHNKTRSVRVIAASTRAVETLETHRAPGGLVLRRLSHKLHPIVPTLGRSFHHLIARLNRIPAAGILVGHTGGNPDQAIRSRANHRGSIKTILAGTPADLVTAGHLSICSSLS
jgi:hypothetical protein